MDTAVNIVADNITCDTGYCDVWLWYASEKLRESSVHKGLIQEAFEYQYISAHNSPTFPMLLLKSSKKVVILNEISRK